MKNKGFTLVELLAVIILLGVLASMVTVTVNKSIQDSKQKLYDIQINNIKEGAKIWANDNVFSLPNEENGEKVLNLSYLQELGYVEKDIKNPKTNELFNGDIVKVKITKVGNSYEYTVIGG